MAASIKKGMLTRVENIPFNKKLLRIFRICSPAFIDELSEEFLLVFDYHQYITF